VIIDLNGPDESPHAPLPVAHAKAG
jgi:hypothetical protein